MNSTTSKRMLSPKNFLGVLAFLAPLLALIWFSLFPQTDARITLPLFHFYIVTFTSFSAAVISILLLISLREVAQPRHYLAALAFAVIGAIFFAHGIATPGALIDYAHPAVSWSSGLTLFSGGLIFALAALGDSEELPDWLSVRRMTYLALISVTLYFIVVLFVPHLLEWLTATTNPWQHPIVFYITLGLWVFAAFRWGRVWRQTSNRIDGASTFVALWLSYATLSLHQFPPWHISWWLYHFILLVGFLVTVYILLTEYEQGREFQVLRYYLAASLIVTALMALIASYLFAEFSYRVLLTEKQTASAHLISLITQKVAETLPEDVLPAQALTLYARTLPTYLTSEVTVYNDKGESFSSGNEKSDASSDAAQNTSLPDHGSAHGPENSISDPTQSLPNILSPENRSNYEQVLLGEMEVQFQNSLITTYAPLYLTENQNEPPIGVVVASQTAQDFIQAILQARRSGLLITTLSMSVLFGILLLIVARADRIITTRGKELRLAYKNLRQAEGVRDDLTNMIIHDLRNPLSIIYGTLGLVQYLNDNDEYRAKRSYHLDQALRASERITGLIDDILAVSKIEAGQLKPNLKPTSVSQLLSDRLNGFAGQATEENRQLTLDCPADLQASCDANLIGRVVDNLVSNALKYTGEGGRVQVAAWADNGHLLIRIRDDGGGIPDEYKRHIFEKFAQAPNATTRQGTGLGLAFCGLAVQLHEGKIWVEDAPAGGSDFIFRLPECTKDNKHTP